MQKASKTEVVVMLLLNVAALCILVYVCWNFFPVLYHATGWKGVSVMLGFYAFVLTAFVFLYKYGPRLK